MLSEDQAFSQLKKRILTDRGFDCAQYKESYLKRRLSVRLRATGSEGYVEYLGVLRSDPEEYTRLLNELTINVTRFFRDRDVFTRIRDDVIPAILRRKADAGSRTLRAWSAGCATGEEPYSLAILICYRLGSSADKWNVRVTGTDVDDESLRVARSGTYREVDILEGMNPGVYFEQMKERGVHAYRVRDNIRRKVRFENAGLMDESRRRHYDLVLCRNVLIYFERDMQNRIVDRIASSLARGGYFIVGKSEIISREAAEPFEAVFPRERIYRLASKGVNPEP